MAKKRKKTNDIKGFNERQKAAIARLKVSETQTNISKKRDRFLITFASTMCNISETCSIVGISRNTFYVWLKDPTFEQNVRDCKEAMLDKLEQTALSMAIDSKNTAMTIFLLKTQAAQRGYIENKQVKVEVTNKQSIKLPGSNNTIEF